MNLTTAEYQAILARQAAQATPEAKPSNEQTLHYTIASECARRRFYVVHSRMDRPTTQAIGTPDFIVALPGGRTLWVECKRPGGKLRPEQGVARHCLLALDHIHAVVHTIAEFRALLPDETETTHHVVD